MKYVSRMVAALLGVFQLSTIVACTAEQRKQETLVDVGEVGERLKTGDATAVSRTDCKTNSGVILDYCITGTPVSCFKNQKGEYCTQYTEGSNGRMWGPF